MEVGQGLLRVQSNSRYADVLVDAWDRAKPAAFDVTVTSPLLCMTRVILQVLQLTKQSAESTFPMPHLAVESYGNWGKEAQNTFARLASILSISLHCPKAKVLWAVEYLISEVSSYM